MQFTAIISFLFVAAAIAAPITVSHRRQIDPTGVNNFGNDGVMSKTDGKGAIVPYDTKTGKV